MKEEAPKIQIVDYQPAYRVAFKKLNEEWITRYFKMEESDHKALDHPQENIIDMGGYILFALHDGEPVGTCALIKMDGNPYDFELAKMTVAPQMQGKHIGWLLGQSVIEKARSLGAVKLFLESNSMLKPAINLYRKLGFREIAGHSSAYQRCDIQMELTL